MKELSFSLTARRARRARVDIATGGGGRGRGISGGPGSDVSHYNGVDGIGGGDGDRSGYFHTTATATATNNSRTMEYGEDHDDNDEILLAAVVARALASSPTPAGLAVTPLVQVLLICPLLLLNTPIFKDRTAAIQPYQSNPHRNPR